MKTKREIELELMIESLESRDDARLRMIERATCVICLGVGIACAVGLFIQQRCVLGELRAATAQAQAFNERHAP
jgi:hypothetical protein